jgi:hypothetical protein
MISMKWEDDEMWKARVNGRRINVTYQVNRQVHLVRGYMIQFSLQLFCFAAQFARTLHRVDGRAI